MYIYIYIYIYNNYKKSNKKVIIIKIIIIIMIDMKLEYNRKKEMRTGQKTSWWLQERAQIEGRSERAETRCSQSRKRTPPSKAAKKIHKKRETDHERTWNKNER